MTRLLACGRQNMHKQALLVQMPALHDANLSYRAATLDFDMGDPRKLASEWEQDDIFIKSWDRRKNKLVVQSRDKKGLIKWLIDVYGLDKRDAQKAVR